MKERDSRVEAEAADEERRVRAAMLRQHADHRHPPRPRRTLRRMMRGWLAAGPGPEH